MGRSLEECRTVDIRLSMLVRTVEQQRTRLDFLWSHDAIQSKWCCRAAGLLQFQMVTPHLIQYKERCIPESSMNGSLSLAGGRRARSRSMPTSQQGR